MVVLAVTVGQARSTKADPVSLDPGSMVRIATVDAGRLTGDGQPPRHFVHAAAAGLNLEFARFATRGDLRRRLGRLTYAVAAALALRERPVFSCDLEHEGGREQLQLVHLAVINAPVFGGFLDLKIPGAAPDDRSLNVLMVEHLPMRRLIRSALYPAIGMHRRIRERASRASLQGRLRRQGSKSYAVTIRGTASTAGSNSSAVAYRFGRRLGAAGVVA